MTAIQQSPNFVVAAPGSPADTIQSEARVVRMPPPVPSSAGAPPSIKCRKAGLPPGDLGVAKTIHAMDHLAGGREGAQSPSIRSLAIAVVKPVANRDADGEIQALFNWVKSHIKFRGEHGETLQSPEITVRLAAGDCDCQAVLLAALLRSIGYTTRFVTVAADPREPESFSHVYIEVFDKKTGGWISLDTTDAKSEVGWRPGAVYRRRSWRSLAGLGDQTVPTAFPGLPATGATDSQEALALINQFGQPLINAAAQRLAYGQAPFAPGLSPTPLGGGISPINQGNTFNSTVLLGVGLALLLAMSQRRR